MADHLKSRKDVRVETSKKRTSRIKKDSKIQVSTQSGSYLHDGDSSVGDGGPIDGADHDTSSSEGAGLRDEPISQVQHIDHRT